MRFSTTLITALGASLFTSELVSAEGGLRKGGSQRHLIRIKVYGSNPVDILGLCEGDCDIDEDCGEGLICFQREKNQAIPGCDGGLGDNSRTDYCIPDIPSIAPSSGPSSALSPRVEDETSTSNSPSSSLSVSQEPTTTQPSAQPSQEPSLSFQPSEEPSISNKPTIEEKPLWPLQFFGATPNNDKLPLGPCSGDCDTDDDCDDGLYCHIRDRYEPSPGCLNAELDGSRTDFCAYLEDRPPVPSPTPDFFRMKLYWQEGYDWQEESFEREFCMKCKNGCFEGNRLYITECSSYSSFFDYVNVGSSDEVLIEVSGKDVCLERANQVVSLAICNETLPTQRWFAKDGSFEGDKVEISQHGFENYCLTQHHHPKHGEEIYMDLCARAIRDYTEFWNKY
jgi:hypothetical protein